MLSPEFKTTLKRNALIFCAAVIALVWQFFFPGYYHKVVDDAIYAQKLFPQFVESFRQGALYPRWMAENVKGYGLPVFIYYPPSLYFASGVLGLAGTSLTWSLTLLRFLGLYIGSLFIYYLLRDRAGARAALIAAFAYALLPTRVVDLYLMNTPAGRFSEVFLPMTLFFTGKYMEGPFTRRGLAWASMSYSALVLSHLVTAYIFTPFLVAYGLFVPGELPAAKRVLRLSLGMAAGLCISSIFLVPVLFERGLVHLDIILEHSYARNFVFNFSDVRPFEATEQLRSILKNTVTAEAVMTAALLYIAKRWRNFSPGREMKFFFLASLACLFMMSSLSGFFWENVPGLKTIQFPFRFNAVYLVFLPPLLGIVLDKLTRPKADPVFLTAAVAVLLMSLAVCDASLVKMSFPPVTETDTRAFIARFDMLEYLPKTVDTGMLDRLREDDPPLSSSDSFVYNINRWGYIDRAFSVDSPRGVRLRVKTFYFPGWKGWVDGAGTGLAPEAGSGAIIMTIPPGRHAVNLKFTDTPVRKIGAWLSVLTFAALLVPNRLFIPRPGPAPAA